MRQTLKSTGIDNVQELIIQFGDDNGYNPDNYNAESLAKRLIIEHSDWPYESLRQSLRHYIEHGTDNNGLKFDRFRLNYADIVRWFNRYTANNKPVENRYREQENAFNPSKAQIENQNMFMYLYRFFEYYAKDENNMFCGWRPDIQMNWIRSKGFYEEFLDEMDALTIKEELIAYKRSEVAKKKLHNSFILDALQKPNNEGGKRSIRHISSLSDGDIEEMAYLVSHYRMLEVSNLTPIDVLKEYKLKIDRGAWPVVGDKQYNEFLDGLR